MDNTNNTTNSKKNKHLTYNERVKIEILLVENYSPYAIAKKLGRASNTIRNEIKRGTTQQIYHGKENTLYLADCGQAVYETNRKNINKPFKILRCADFIKSVVTTMKDNKWSVDASVNVISSAYDTTQSVCTKTVYNYIDLGLLEIKPIDLPLKVRRKNKAKRVRQNKMILGKSISERPEEIDTREEFGHWEIDTVIGKKGKQETVLLTIAERQTRQFLIRKIENKSTNAVLELIHTISNEYGDKFNEVFKSITSDNGLEFAELSKLESIGVKVYFAHPYTSCERDTNERHNGLLRRFIPKGKSIDKYSTEQIFWVEDWCNTLPRKILNYKTPEQLFEQELDRIYAC